MTDPTLSFRRAIAGDCEALTTMTQSSSAYAGTYRAILDGYAVTPSQIQRDEYHVAECNGDVVGYFGLVIGPEPELDLMFVSDRVQGIGIGKALFNRLVTVAKGLGLASVKIVSHPPSLGFYERMGARRVGTKAPAGRVSWERPILVLPIGQP